MHCFLAILRANDKFKQNNDHSHNDEKWKICLTERKLLCSNEFGEIYGKRKIRIC